MSINFGISKTELSRIIDIDAKLLSTHPDQYIQANCEAYTIACNTWLYMCYDVAGPVANRVLKAAIMQHGLVKIIDECSDLANRAIRSGFSETNSSPLRALFVEDKQLTLQLLRFLKRFSPLRADRKRDEALNKFLALNKRHKGFPAVIDSDGKVLLRWHPYPRWLIKSVKEYVNALLPPTANLDDETIHFHGEFSNGATAEGCHTLLEKLRAFSTHCCAFYSPLYPISDTYVRDDVPVKVVTVPKSYKTVRVIAEVSAYRQFHLQGIRKLAEDSISSSAYSDLIVLSDQRFNQEWSRLGSVYGTFATIDLSGASDSIAETLAYELLPSNWYNAIRRWNPTMLNVDGKVYPRYIFQTSGNGSTFVIESIIFLAIALTATSYVTTFLQESVKMPRVFGDDIICDTRVYDTLVDFLGLLGFTVNTDKSFGYGSDYRESCGAEWYCGLDMSTKYFPRKELDPKKPEFLESVISLQHRLFGFPTTDEWLVRHIRECARAFGVSELTSSEPGVDCEDLWEEYPVVKQVYPPYNRKSEPGWNESISEFLKSSGNMREVHTALVGKLPSSKWLASHPISQSDYALLELWRYVSFLKNGPSYDEYGISIRRNDILCDAYILSNVFTNVKR